MRRTTPIPDRAVDEWIDLFRDVFLRNESGIRVLSMLAARWGFFDRSVTTEERRIQRQCFMDLLICCGVFENDTGERLLRLLLGQPDPKRRIDRVWNWLLSWQHVRTRRQEEITKDVPKGKQ
jgi:hypothetical protein